MSHYRVTKLRPTLDVLEDRLCLSAVSLLPDPVPPLEPVPAQVDYFLKLKGIDGESTDHSKPADFDIRFLTADELSREQSAPSDAPVDIPQTKTIRFKPGKDVDPTSGTHFFDGRFLRADDVAREQSLAADDGGDSSDGSPTIAVSGYIRVKKLNS